MSKIIIIAEKINNEVKFIKTLRQLTGQSISEIKNSLTKKKPFFEGILEGNRREENEEIVKNILHFTHQDGDSIRLFRITDPTHFETHEGMYEITQEMFENSLRARKETSEYFDDFDQKDF